MEGPSTFVSVAGRIPDGALIVIYVGYLRRKLGKELIETVRGMGYRLVVDRSE